MAAFAAEAVGKVFGVGGVVDAVLGEGKAPGFAAVGGGPGVEALEVGGVAGEVAPEAFPGTDADGLAVGDVVGGSPELAGAGAGGMGDGGGVEMVAVGDGGAGGEEGGFGGAFVGDEGVVEVEEEGVEVHGGMVT